jgi:16S rRNA (cytosine967-C5)-methyltransferase
MTRSPADSRPVTLAAPLSEVLLASATAVAAVLGGASLTDALARTPQPLRPATQSVSFHVMRNLGRARAVKELLVTRQPADPRLDALLLTAFALVLEETGGPYAVHTVVDQAVEAAAADRTMSHAKGMVNGSLRRFLREREDLLTLANKQPAARWNYPQWWVDRVKTDYPDSWQDILRAADAPAPMGLRVNRRRTTIAAQLAAFEAAGVPAEALGDYGIVLPQPRPVHQLPGFAEGHWSVQDAGAQLAAPALGVRDGMRVLDACAAPGGKTAHLLELADVDLLALDVDESRLGRVRENLDRLGLDAAMKAADVSDLDSWWDGKPFDAILADVPCTASGIVRRHPDIRWLRRPEDVKKTARLQVRIADALWQVLAPGGKLLYATCSVFAAENAAQAAAFLARHPDAKVLPAPGQLLPRAGSVPLSAQHDGFFYSLFAKG